MSALARSGVVDPAGAMTLFARWDEMAGEPWAGVSRPVGWEGGELLVEVDSAAVAGLLRYCRDDLLIQLGRWLGEGRVTTVRVKVADYTRPS